MDNRTTVVIQLADVWGDELDSLGFDRHVIDMALAHRPASSLTILLPSQERCRRQQETRRGLKSPHIAAQEAFSLETDQPGEVVLACRGGRPDRIIEMDRYLGAAGYVRAGRAWGEAGENRRYLRCLGPGERLRAAINEVRVQAGSTFVSIRDGFANPDRIRARFNRTRRALGLGVPRRDSLDDDFGTVSASPRVDLRDVLPEGFGVDRPEWSLPFEDTSPAEAAHSCFDQLGVWPLSFSYPGEALPLAESPKVLVAPIVPGIPYSYDDETTYRAQYHNAYLALTHRKAGWDCFRHVEIMATGAVPLMADAEAIPSFAMVHYPKRSMARVVRQVARTGGPPAPEVRRAFRSWWENHLTSRGMARYLLSCIGLDEDARVLFVDEQIPATVDYQSVLTLIGLKQVLGSNCHVLFPATYIYNDSRVETSTLYGRGFGYTRTLSADVRTSFETAGIPPSLSIADYDAVIVGSITRNVEPARRLLSQKHPSRHVWIHGEDTPPTIREVMELRSAGTHLFVRAIHTGPTRSP
jgi:hypothetical protein